MVRRRSLRLRRRANAPCTPTLEARCLPGEENRTWLSTGGDGSAPRAGKSGRGRAMQRPRSAALIHDLANVILLDREGVDHVARVAGDVVAAPAGRPADELAADAGRPEGDDETNVGIGPRQVHDARARAVAHQGVPVAPVVPRLGIRDEARVAVVEPVPVLAAAAHAG